MIIWEAKKYSRNLCFWGMVLINILVTYPLLTIGEVNFGEIFLASSFLGTLMICFLYWKNPVLLSLTDEGIYLRGKFFVPYNKIICCRVVPLADEKISILVNSEVIENCSYLFLRSGFSLITSKFDTNIREIHFFG